MTDNGGPAFPEALVDLSTGSMCIQRGMSLRDWFATFAPPIPDWWCGECTKPDSPYFTTISSQREIFWRYRYADDMIAERRKTEEILDLDPYDEQTKPDEQ